MALKDKKLPDYTLGEELCNAITHGIGAGLSIAALVLAVVRACTVGDVWGVVSSAIYGSMLILLYTNSCVYHALARNNGKRVMRVLDHCMVYVLIAGTYTPYTLVTLRSVSPALGWTIFGIVWGAAAFGISLTAVNLEKYSRFSMICYIAMGWCVIGSFVPLVKALGWPGTILLLLGGVLYTVGAVIYGVGKKVRYMHSVFHVFVVAASVLQFFSIYFYVLPTR